ncbi:MAG: flavin prenyltransferase UbiX [Syntrophomonadaceae bacterium]|nr:flavin prenyltransferase UbiX [Syntrophomonadaceae bacterium]
MGRYIVGITGASGAVYGIELINRLLAGGHELHVVISPAAELVMHDELGLELEGMGLNERRALFADGKLLMHDYHDIAAVIASGSYLCDAMIIAPCSMGSLSAVSGGRSDNLIERAADVMLKERRPLVLVPRETPLSSVHLRNMLRLSEDGAVIVPAMPAFYHKPQGVGDMVDFVVGKVLDVLRLPHDIFARYRGNIGDE